MDFVWTEQEKEYFKNTNQFEQRNALANAFLARDWVAFQWIVGQGVHPNDVSYDMLWDAVRKEDIDAVKRLLAYNYDVHRVDDVAFRDAVRLGNMELAAILQQAGADVRAVNDEAMSLAAENGDVIFLKQLRAWGVPVEGWKNDPIIRAISVNAKDAVKELLRMGATLADEEGFYLAIRAAIRTNDPEMGKIIVKHIKDMHDVIEQISESDSFLPEDWRQRLEHWRLMSAMA